MSRPYTVTDFSEHIAQDLTWRIKEISDIKVSITRSDRSLQRVLLRALVTICYAHWEGYVKSCAQKYIDFIAARKLQYKNLNVQFLKNYLLPRLTAMSNSSASLSERCLFIDTVLNSSDQRFTKINKELISTRSNLSFSVLVDLCIVCSIPIELFSEKASFIDNILLHRRNAIAHGEDTFVDIADLDQIAENTITLMRSFGYALENNVALETYKAA